MKNPSPHAQRHAEQINFIQVTASVTQAKIALQNYYLKQPFTPDEIENFIGMEIKGMCKVGVHCICNELYIKVTMQ